MTDARLDRQHSLLQLINHFYLTDEGKEEKVSLKERRMEEILQQLLDAGVEFEYRGRDAAAGMAAQVFEYEHVLKLLSA